MRLTRIIAKYEVELSLKLLSAKNIVSNSLKKRNNVINFEVENMANITSRQMENCCESIDIGDDSKLPSRVQNNWHQLASELS